MTCKTQKQMDGTPQQQKPVTVGHEQKMLSLTRQLTVAIQ